MRLTCRTLLVAPSLLAMQVSLVAGDEIRVSSVTAAAGDRDVIVTIEATTEQRLTLLNADILFDVDLCQSIENEELRSAGRSEEPPQEGGTRCPLEGRVNLVQLNLLGNAAIPPGDGPIAEWVFDVRDGVAGAVFPLDIRVNQASNGPLAVELDTLTGEVRIQGAPPGTPTATVPPTVPPTSTPAPTDTPTTAPTATPGGTCAGDCDGSGTVSINELVLAVNIALGSSPTSACAAADTSGDGNVTVNELVGAVNAALAGCP